MHDPKRKRLEAKGWRVGTAQQFLSLSPQETAYIELRLLLKPRTAPRAGAEGPDTGRACPSDPL